MQTVRILQTVTLLMVVALAASCAASKEYTSKIFAPRTEVAKDSSVTALRFLELDKLNPEGEGWVKTDIVAKDSSNTGITPVIADIKPVTPKDSATAESKITPVASNTKKLPVDEQPVARSTTNQDGTRTKSTREK
jgi:hypothetical protein